jgi:choline dehydrogenase-like flavoprotein
MHRGISLTAEMCFAAGARRVYTGLIGDDALESKADLLRFKKRKLQKSELALIGYHPLGTCRMGTDKRTSVVNLHHESHDVKGLFVVDGSAVNGPLGVNPQVTIMGMAMRAAEHLHDRL